MEWVVFHKRLFDALVLNGPHTVIEIYVLSPDP